MSEHYYIDGYNVLYKSRQLRPLAMQDFESAREALVDKVAPFCVATGKRVTIVFDGRGQSGQDSVGDNRGVGLLEVIYAPEGRTADAYIERRVYKTAKRLNVVVVSNDHGLRDLCQGMGSLVMESESFLQSVREVRSETMDAFHDTRPNRATAHDDNLEHRVDPAAREQLQALRDKLEGRGKK